MSRPSLPTSCADSRDLYWLAGLLEGEGYFGIIKNWVGSRCYRYPRLGLNMTDHDVVSKAALLLGCRVYNLKPQGTGALLPQYRLVIVGSRAVGWMRELRPLMGRRRQHQIDTCLIEWDLRPSANVMRSHTMKKVIKTRDRNTKGQVTSPT